LVEFKASLQVPGRVQLSDTDGFYIELDKALEGNNIDIAAVLAHEMCHIYLFCEGLVPAHENDFEILTDTSSTCLGTGILTLNAAVTQTVHHFGFVETKHRSFGYLTPYEVGYVLAKRAAYFGEEMKSRLLTERGREALELGRRLVRQDYTSPPLATARIAQRFLYLWQRRGGAAPHDNGKGYYFESGREHVVFTCPVCSQKLRLPTRRRDVRVTCANCVTPLQCRS
jgi:hypothetical protein